MASNCTRNRSFLALAALWLWIAPAAADQKAEVQRLVQSGAYEQAAEAARDGDPASTYVAAQALIKAERNDRAAAEFARLRASGNDSWRLVGESGDALMAGDADGNNAFAQYQLGLAASRAGDWGAAEGAFARALQLKGDFAYAHYYKALVHQRLRQLPRAAEHFDAFLRLAPDAPERSAVQAIMRTLK
jgi:tetratricopeptide (TPR) repeat protein